MPFHAASLLRNAIRNHSAKHFLFAGLLVVLVSLCPPNARAQMPAAKPQGYVSDYAGVLSGTARSGLEALSAELDQKAHAQLALVTVKSLEGRPIEDFSIELATKWGIGTKAKKAGDQTADRGVLLIIAVEDHRDRIEVGYGLEPIIPDGKAGGILRAMTPYLRNGDYDSALALGASSIASIIAEDAKISLGASLPRPASLPRESDGQQKVSPLTVFIILLFLAPFLLFSRRGGRPGGFFYTGGGFSGGGFSGGGGGFGGFGGGSFGGGGASGSW
jgi:uncharacterized protein